MAGNLLDEMSGFRTYGNSEGPELKRKLPKWLCAVLVCSFAVLCAAGARAQADPVGQSVLCPNQHCGRNAGRWTVLTSQTLSTPEFANSGGAETGTLALVGSRLLLFGLAMRKKIPGAQSQRAIRLDP